MKLATWNVNSIRARADRVVAWVERSDVDVIAIQETKATDEKFPYDRFVDLGYQVAHHGISQWNGVAILSRVGIEDVQVGFEGMPSFGDPAVAEARAIGATCGGIRVWSLYVPNGRALHDPHFDYKIAWYEALRADATAWLAADPAARIALCGDFNVAPTDEDVWDMAAFVDSTHVSPAERSAFRSLIDAGFTDVVRPHTPGPGTYTYWDYQQLRFAKRQGMRIDFALCSPALAARVTSAVIDREERKGKGASDHTPVIVEFADDTVTSGAVSAAAEGPADV
ncbi:exodeoxyribonuclease III [Nakamurella silvestris]|nr:exodeoxyribonuclease III [Nakamurella silvestris]